MSTSVTSRGDFKEERKDVIPAKPIHAPNDVGFTHTSNEQFTYFSGSEAGARSTFGMPSAEFSAVVKKFVDSFLDENKSKDKTVVQLCSKLSKMNEKIADLAVQLKHKNIYSHPIDVADGICDSGHIPIILSKATAAEQYGIAARRVKADNIVRYFKIVSDAEDQAREYLVKQQMVSEVVKFRSTIFQERYQVDRNSADMICYNQLVAGLDGVISSNQKTMPRDCEQFDLFETFREKIYEMVDRLEASTIIDKKVIEEMRNAMYSCAGNTYAAQKKLSDALYVILNNYIPGATGLKKSDKEEEISLTEKQDAILQKILPLLAYLNSCQNPFARLGLFGDEVVNDFHTKALTAYQLHESKENVDSKFKQLKEYDKKHPEEAPKKTNEEGKETEVEYDGDQIVQLIYGPSEQQKKDLGVATSFMARFSATVAGLLSEGSAGSAESKSTASGSERRRKLLALPMPEQYLMLKAPEAASKPKS